MDVELTGWMHLAMVSWSSRIPSPLPILIAMTNAHPGSAFSAPREGLPVSGWPISLVIVVLWEEGVCLICFVAVCTTGVQPPSWASFLPHSYTPSPEQGLSLGFTLEMTPVFSSRPSSLKISIPDYKGLMMWGPCASWHELHRAGSHRQRCEGVTWFSGHH